MRELVCGALVALVMSGSLVAGTTGKITGTIVNKTTCEPIPFAVVQIVGTTMGAQADVDGCYEITRVPAGVWSLRAMLTGWVSSSVDSIAVDSNHVEFVDFELTESTYEQEYMITGCGLSWYLCCLLRLNETGKVKTYTAEELKERPAGDVRETLRRTGGVVYR